MFEIYAVNLKRNINPDLYNKLLELISNDKKSRIEKFRRNEDKIRGLTADILIRCIIKNNLNIPNDEIIFYTNKYGKPFLKNYPGFHFNTSHSGEWVVCGISDESIGIDVERIKEINFDIAKRFYSPEEYIDLMNVDKNKQLEYFFDLWSLKESYIKNKGMGLSLPLRNFTVKKDINGIFYLLDNPDNYNFVQYKIHSDYKLSVCLKNKSRAEKIIFYTPYKILKELSK